MSLKCGIESKVGVMNEMIHMVIAKRSFRRLTKMSQSFLRLYEL